MPSIFVEFSIHITARFPPSSLGSTLKEGHVEKNHKLTTPPVGRRIVKNVKQVLSDPAKFFCSGMVITIGYPKN